MSEERRPIVSIVMALYNGAAFVDAAIDSVRTQSRHDWELLIVDDGSSDDSLARARARAEEDPRIRVLRHPGGVNRGVSATRNLGMSEARADWIALLDCDDLWLPHKLERQLDVLATRPEVALVYAKAQVVDDAGVPVTEPREGMRRPPVFGSGQPDCPVRDFLGFLQFRYWVPASSAIFRRDLAEACGNFHERLGYQVEDTLLWAQLAERGALWFQDEVLIHYRIHGSQWNSALGGSKKAQSRFAYLSALNRSAVNGHGHATAEALVDRGFAGLGQTLISAWEVRPLRLIGYWCRLLAEPNLTWSLRRRASGMLAGRLAALPRSLFLMLRMTLTSRAG